MARVHLSVPHMGATEMKYVAEAFGSNWLSTVGPNLDAVKPSRELVVDRVTNGQGVMPSFKGKLSPQQIEEVAGYVSSVAGK